MSQSVHVSHFFALRVHNCFVIVFVLALARFISQVYCVLSVVISPGFDFIFLSTIQEIG